MNCWRRSGQRCDSGSVMMCIEQGCPHPLTAPTCRIEFTPEEIAALKREFFPRMLVASVVRGADSDVVAGALYKLDPSILPSYRKHELESPDSH